MFILFCDSVIDPKQVDPDFEAEQEAATAAGLQTALLSYEEWEEQNLRKALRWMLHRRKMVIGSSWSWGMGR